MTPHRPLYLPEKIQTSFSRIRRHCPVPQCLRFHSHLQRVELVAEFYAVLVFFLLFDQEAQQSGFDSRARH